MNHNSKKDNKSISNEVTLKSKTNDDLKIPCLYGMTIEQYNEGLKIHFSCFEPVEKLTLNLINEQCLL